MEEKILPIAKPREGVVFPEEFTLIIQEILKKYDLFKIHGEGVKKLLNSKNPEERKEIAENLPGYKISQFVRDYAEGKTDLEKLPGFLKSELSLSENTVKKIAKDINENILILIKPLKEKNLRPLEVPPEVKPPTPSPEGPAPPKKTGESDIYREPFE